MVLLEMVSIALGLYGAKKFINSIRWEVEESQYKTVGIPIHDPRRICRQLGLRPINNKYPLGSLTKCQAYLRDIGASPHEIDTFTQNFKFMNGDL